MKHDVTYAELQNWVRKANNYRDLVITSRKLYEQGKINRLTYEKVLNMSTVFGIDLLKALS